jgi:hypothetical protein
MSGGFARAVAICFSSSNGMNTFSVINAADCKHSDRKERRTIMKCYHHNDLDGRCAAAIVLKAKKDFFPEIPEETEMIAMDYKDAVDVSRIKPNELVIIVDFSFKPEIMAEILNITREVIWIDHHATAKDYPYQDLPGTRDFTDKGLSGCELTWVHFYPDLDPPPAVKLIGDYDSWRLRSQPHCFNFYEGMKLKDTRPGSDLWAVLLEGGVSRVSQICAEGGTAILYRDNYCAGVRKAFGYPVCFEGHIMYATNFYMFGSRGFGKVFNLYDACIAYIHDGEKFTVSLYSEKIDVSAIASKHGGGGHKGAAGFVCRDLPFKPAPKDQDGVPRFFIANPDHGGIDP